MPLYIILTSISSDKTLIELPSRDPAPIHSPAYPDLVQDLLYAAYAAALVYFGLLVPAIFTGYESTATALIIPNPCVLQF
jgi:hypothetical protein